MTLTGQTFRFPLRDPSDAVFKSGLGSFTHGGCWSSGWETHLAPVLILRGDYHLMIRAKRFDTVSISVWMNGKHVGDLDLAPGFHDYTVTIPEAFINQGVNDLLLKYSRIFQPVDTIKASGDTRFLAVFYKEILIVPKGNSLDPVNYPFKKNNWTATENGISMRFPARIITQVVLADAGELRLSLVNHGSHDGNFIVRTGSQAHPAQPLPPHQMVKVSLPLKPAASGLKTIEIFFTGVSDDGLCEITTLEVVQPAVPELKYNNIILVIVDTLRSDRLGCYGFADGQTPVLDGLSRHGVVFPEAYSHIPITGPSHASMFTGQYPHQAGVRCNVQALPDSAQTLAGCMKAAGYATAGFVSAGVINRQFGYDNGFDYYQNCLSPIGFTTAEVINQSVLNYLDKQAIPEHQFLFLHYYDPHFPYSPPGIKGTAVKLTSGTCELSNWNMADGSFHTADWIAPPGISRINFQSTAPNDYYICVMGIHPNTVRIKSRHGWSEMQHTLIGHAWQVASDSWIELENTRSEPCQVTLRCTGYDTLDPATLKTRYTGEVAFWDRQFGRLLRELQHRGITQNSLVIITSDHGESFGEHGLFGHIHQLYEPQVRIPCLFSGTEIPPSIIPGTYRHIDLFPTVMSQARIPLKLPQWQGRNALSPPPDTSGIKVFCETFSLEAREDVFSIRSRGQHLLFFPGRTESRQRFNLQNDPGEQSPLSSPAPELWNDLQQWIPSLDLGTDPAESKPLDAETHQMLQALGYLQK